MWRTVRTNVWAVIRREYLQRVRSRWFLFATVVAPLLMAGLIVVPAYFSRSSARAERTLTVVDATGVLYERIAPDLEEGGWSVERAEWTSGALAALERRAEAGEIGGFVVLDDRTLATGEATLYTADRPNTLRRFQLQSTIARAALEHGLEDRGVDAGALLGGGALNVELLSEAGAGEEDPQFLTAYVGAFLLYMVILLYSVAVMRATLEEKTSRIVEVVISSMEPWHLMLGKIVGVGAVAFTQLGAWLATGILLSTLGLPMLLAARPDFADLSTITEALPDARLLALFVGFFVCGFLMYSALYAAVGAMCSTDEEAQQAQFPLVIFIIVPIMLVLPVIESPMSPMATWASLFPLFTPILMWGRVAGGGVPPWQVALSFALMLGAILAIAWLAGRIYKTGILMTGKRPTLPELWRWVREA
jgi:ABC-2 type transport system permease protein